MDFEDFIISPRNFKTESWQIGNRIAKDIKEDSIVLLFVSDYRGSGGDAEVQDFTAVRKEFYKLSQMDFEIPVVRSWRPGVRKICTGYPLYFTGSIVGMSL